MRTEVVTRLRAARVTDRYSKQPTKLDWTTVAEQPYRTLAPAQPVTSTEPDEPARDSVISGYRVYLPTTADVTAKDRLRVAGVVHEIDGRPELRPGFALVVTTKLVEG